MLVEKETELNEPQQDGSSKREHLESIARQTGEEIEELQLPDLPPAGWRMRFLFSQLSASRSWVGGPQQLEFTEIQAWSNLTGIKLTQWELNTLHLMDIRLINTANQIVTNKRKQKNG